MSAPDATAVLLLLLLSSDGASVSCSLRSETSPLISRSVPSRLLCNADVGLALALALLIAVSVLLLAVRSDSFAMPVLWFVTSAFSGATFAFVLAGKGPADATKI